MINKFDKLNEHYQQIFDKMIYKVSALHTGAEDAQKFIENIAGILEDDRKAFVAIPGNEGKAPIDLKDQRNVLSKATALIINHLSPEGSLANAAPKEVAAGIANNLLEYFYEQHLSNITEVSHNLDNLAPGLMPPVSLSKTEVFKANLSSPELRKLSEQWSNEDYKCVGDYLWRKPEGDLATATVFIPRNETDPLRIMQSAIVYNQEINSGKITIHAGELTNALIIGTPNESATLQVSQIAGTQNSIQGDTNHLVSKIESLPGLHAFEYIAGAQRLKDVSGKIRGHNTYHTEHSNSKGNCHGCALVKACASSIVKNPSVTRDSNDLNKEQGIGA